LKKISFTHIASLGLFLLLLLQVMLTVQAMGLARQAADTVKTISGTLNSRLKKLTAIDKSLSQAYYLFRLDKNKEIITSEDILLPLADFERKILSILEQTSSVAEKEHLRRYLPQAKILRQGILSITEMGHEPADYTTHLVEQVQSTSSTLRRAMSDFEITLGNNPDDPRRLPLHEAGEFLSHFDSTLLSYLDMESLDISALVHILAQAESVLQMLRLSITAVDEPDSQKIRSLESLLALLRTNLPSAYYGQDIDPNISLAAEGLDSLATTWDQMIYALSDLRIAQENSIAQAEQKLWAATIKQRMRFFTLACLTIAAGLIITFLMRSILISRIREMANGTKKIADGNFAYRLEIHSKDYLGNLAQSFNAMAETLAIKESQIRKNLEQLRFSKMQLGLSHLDLEEKIFERTADLRAANEQLQLMGEVFEHSLEGIIILDTEGSIIKVNPSFSTLTGYTEHETIGQDSRFLETDEHDLLPYGEIRKTVATTGSWCGEVWIQRKDKEVIAVWLSLSTMRNENGVNTGFIAIFHDISELKNQADIIQHQALHDPLTELPNRLLLKDRMDVAISHAQRSKEKLAIVFLDLDNFKTINDTLGHDHGDILLQEVASRLMKVIRPGDTVCRMGGDEFVVLVDNLEAKDGVRVVAARIQKELTTAFIIKGRNLFISASIGIAFFPDDGEDTETLIKHADLAMYQAKTKGKNIIQLFTAGMNEAALERLALEEDIRTALGNTEFTVHLQPKISLATMEVLGFEALARWQHPIRGMVSPLTFIPICEEAGLIVPLGLHILKVACLKGMELMAGNPEAPLHIAVNISIKQLQHERFISDIKQIMEETGIKAENLEFEITESVLMSDPERTLKILHTIADMGISIAIDDFGTGYSSLFYLKHFPVSTLKIDKSFIDDITTDASSDQIVETIIAMAQRLGLKVVAEGVEEKEQLEHLQKLGCDIIQGYYFSKPLPSPEAAAFLATFRGL
jgi:diguanylate cyclase (GGDEF)-like protein/PAS domain S-box-containing protein